MIRYKFALVLGLFALGGCNPDPIATATYATSSGKRELFAFPPPKIKNTNDLSEVTKVNIVFCRWSGGSRNSDFGSSKGIPNILLHCNFDTDTQKQLEYRRPTFLTMKTRWQRIGDREYEVSSFKLKTPTQEIRIADERDNCSTQDCRLTFHKLELPNAKKENLVFGFTVNTKVSEDNNKSQYDTAIRFEGVAPRTPGR